MRDHLAHDVGQRLAVDIAQRHPAAVAGAGVPAGISATNTVRCSGKCVNTCSTTPGRCLPVGGQRSIRIAPPRLVVGRATRCPAPPPCRRAGPWARGCASSSMPSALTATNAAPRRSLPSTFFSLRGNVSAVPSMRPRQGSRHGQSPQAGLLGEQKVALFKLLVAPTYVLIVASAIPKALPATVPSPANLIPV